MNRQRVENLPLNGRSFLSIAGLEPGVSVSYASNSGPGNPNNFFQVSVAGAPQSLTVISFDGARVNGRTTGGTLKTSLRKASRNSRSAPSTSIYPPARLGGSHQRGLAHRLESTPRQRILLLPRSQYGGVSSAATRSFLSTTRSSCADNTASAWAAPIKQDKRFFFGNYERNDQVGARTVVFTDPLLTGLNHVAQQPLKGHLSGLRLDYRINDSHALFLRGNIDNNKSLSGTGIESGWSASNNYSYQTALGLTSVLKPTLVNDFRFSYSYFRNRLAPPTQSECQSVSGNPLYCFGTGGTRVTFFGGLIIGDDPNVPQDRHPRTYQVTENMNWTKGSHRVRFGGNMEFNVDHGSATGQRRGRGWQSSSGYSGVRRSPGRRSQSGVLPGTHPIWRAGDPLAIPGVAGQSGSGLLAWLPIHRLLRAARYKSFTSISDFNNLFDGFGTANGHRKHRFTGAGIWELPKYQGESKLARGALNSWRLSTLVEMSSGTPTTVTLGTFDVEGDGTFTYRLPGTGPNTFGSGQSAADIRKLVDQYNAKLLHHRILLDQYYFGW